MKRREFLAASCVGGLAPLGAAAGAVKGKPGKELYELRLYRVASGEKARALDAFLRDAAIPALNRLGIAPVGVFKLMPDANPKAVPMGPDDVYVILPHATSESLTAATARLMCDAEYMKAGAAVHNAPKKDPVYRRIESSLLLAFDGVPKLAAPEKKDSRIFQFRIYESHNERAAQKKIEMFNAGGELDIFRRCGMAPVFFGEALTGLRVPNLTYMLAFDDMDAGKAAWKKFLGDPAWTKLKREPAYKDTVSNITNIFLRPAEYSQV